MMQKCIARTWYIKQSIVMQIMNAFEKQILFSILSILMVMPALAQDSIGEINKQEKVRVKHPNIIKINTLAIPFNNFALTYERSIIPRLTVGIGIGYKYGGLIPKVFTVENSVINFEMNKINGFSITPDIRYYLKSCDPGKLEGFYAGLYFRYTYYTTAANFEYAQINLPVESPHADMVMKEYGLGIELGYQMILWERFSIDFLFIGSRYSNYRIGYKFDKTPSQEFLDDLSEYVNTVIDHFGHDYNADVKQEKETEFRTTFPFISMRFGLSLGFAF